MCALAEWVQCYVAEKLEIVGIAQLPSLADYLLYIRIPSPNAYSLTQTTRPEATQFSPESKAVRTLACRLREDPHLHGGERFVSHAEECLRCRAKNHQQVSNPATSNTNPYPSFVTSALPALPHLVSLRFTPPSRFDVKNQSTGVPVESKQTVSGIGVENGQRDLPAKVGVVRGQQTHQRREHWRERGILEVYGGEKSIG